MNVCITLASCTKVLVYLLISPIDRNPKEGLLGSIIQTIYQYLPRERAKVLLAKLASFVNNDSILLPKMESAAFQDSLLYRNFRFFTQCRKCTTWFITNNIFCPHCSSKVTEDWEPFRLISCRCSCPTKQEEYSVLSTEERRSLCCYHVTKSFEGNYLKYISVFTFIVEYYRVGAADNMPYLREDQVIALVRNAAQTRANHVLLTSNAYHLYNALGFHEAASMILNHLSTFPDNNDELSVILSHLPDSGRYVQSSGSNITTHSYNTRKRNSTAITCADEATQLGKFIKKLVSCCDKTYNELKHMWETMRRPYPCLRDECMSFCII